MLMATGPQTAHEVHTGSHLSLGFPEEHLIRVLEGFSEGSRGVCGQLWLVGHVGVHVYSSVPCSVHPPVTIKHSEVGSVYGVLVGNAVGVTPTSP